MAYRKTQLVQADLDAKKARIIAGVLDIAQAGGVITTGEVAERAGVSPGTIYNHFADATEMLAGAVAHLLEADRAAIRAAVETQKLPLNALAAAVAVFYARIANGHLARLRNNAPAYHIPMRNELAKLIGAAVTLSPGDRTLAAAAALGAIYGVADADVSAKKGAQAATAFVLRGIGVPAAGARKIAEQV